MALGVWQATIVSEITGLPVAGALITVTQAGTEITANLYVDRNGVGPSTNPTASNSRGFVRFYCDPGRYDIIATYGVDESESWNDVVILDEVGGGIVDDDNNFLAPVSSNVVEPGASYNLISAGDNNTVEGFGSNNVIVGGFGNTIASSGSQNAVVGSSSTSTDGGSNFIFGSNGANVTGSDNVILCSPSAAVTGNENLLFNCSGATIVDVSGSVILSTNSITETGTNNKMILISVDGATIDWSSKSAIIGTSNGSMIESSNSAILFSTANCSISFSNSTIIDSSVGVTINNSDRSHVMSTNQAEIDGFDNVTIVSSQNVIARKKNTLVMGYGPSAPSVSHITIELDAETGDIYSIGLVDIGSLKVGGVDFVNRLNNLTATTNPTINDDSGDGYSPLSLWINTTSNEIFQAISVGLGAANWQLATLTLDNLGNLAVINGSTVGLNLVQLTNPSAITFLRINADNTVSALSDSNFRTALGLGSMAVQNANAIAVTGGTVDNTAIGNTTRSTGKFTDVDLNGNLLLSGVGKKIIGDFSNATATSRTMIQTSTTNSSTFVTALPSGTGNQAQFSLCSTSDIDNGSTLSVSLTASSARIVSNKTGTGTVLPLALRTGTLDALTIETNGDLTINRAGTKLLGQMSDSTVTNNFTIQSSTVNGFTVFNIAPNGTSLIAGYNIYNSSDMLNAGYCGFSGQTTQFRISVGNLGSGVLMPLAFRMGAIQAMTISTVGDVGVGVTSPTTECKLQVSNGIKVGNTNSAVSTVFDWYEKGTFTPIAVGSTTAGAGTYTVQSGSYTRKGNTVTFRLAIGWSAHTGTGNILIDNLPFTSASSGAPVTSSIYCDGLAIGAGKVPSTLISSSSTQISLRAIDQAGGASSQIAMDAAVTVIDITGVYFVN